MPSTQLVTAEDGGFPSSFLSQDVLREYVDLLVRIVEAAGATVIFTGAVLAAVRFAVAAVHREHTDEFVRVRLRRPLPRSGPGVPAGQ